MAGIYSQGGSAGHRYAGWLEQVEAKNFTFGGKVFNGSPSAIYVGSNQVWPWLTHATMQAIVGAFGQTDGKAVIKATNAYLDGIAAQGQAGKAKAQALAALINEDPMMVCSLGLEVQLTVLPAMPWRVLNNNGSAYIDTGFTPNQDTRTIYMAALTALSSGEKGIFGQYTANRRFFITIESNKISTGYGVTYNPTITNADLALHTWEQNKQYFYQDGTLLKTNTYSSFVGGDTLKVAGRNGTTPVPQRAVLAKIWDDGTAVREMYPFIRKVNNVATLGMIDVMHDVLYTNAGSGQFTEEFGYMQNGSWVTWTPSTP